MLSIYPACFYHDEDGGYTVVFPDLNFLATQGENLQEAMEKAVECLAGYLHTCRMDGDNIPGPSPLEKIDAQAVALELDPDDPAGESFVQMVTVDVEAYAKANFERAVKKTLTIPAWLNAAAIEKHINFSKVLQDALKAQLNLS